MRKKVRGPLPKSASPSGAGNRNASPSGCELGAALCRDAPFVQVGASQLLAVARAGCDAGARRLVLIAPTPVWQQMGGLHAGLSGETELALAALPLASLTVLRPIAANASRARGLVERVAAVYTSLQMLAMPRSMEILPSEKLARCALLAMHQAVDGVRILGADKIPALLARDQA